jgi:hypothetical protein
MRRIAILSFAALLTWSSPVLAQQFPFAFPVGNSCCQTGTPYVHEGTTGTAPSCSDITPGPTEGEQARQCLRAQGTLTWGKCTDGVCGGSPVCCQGVSIGETCTAGSASPNSCAVAPAAICNANSPAGEHATESVPFATCSSGTCVSASAGGCGAPVCGL